MQEPINTTDDIFSSTSEDGAIMRRLHVIAQYLFVVSILTSVLAIYLFIPNIKVIQTLADQQPGSKFLMQGISSAIYTIVFAVLFPVQVYFYFRFAQTSKRTVLKGNESTPHNALRFLLKNAWISCITFTLNFLYFLFLLATDMWAK